MLELIKKTIKKYGLIKNGDKILVGLSGGADSMCLTHALCKLADEMGITVAAAHVNHNIRGEAADNDAKTAKEFAQSLRIEFFLESVQVSEYARVNHLSEELAGRELRYAFFERLMKEHGFTRLATAHNKNDNAETILMNFMRGSGISGLCGIPVKRDNIIRPLLEVTRSQIENYCAENKLGYVTDETNLEEIYTRNKVRLSLIPEIQKSFNANFINTVTKNASIINDENDYISIEAQKLYDENNTGNTFSVEALNKAHIAVARRTVMLILADRLGSLADISSKAVEDIIDLCRKNHTGKRINLPGGKTARLEYGKLIIAEQEKKTPEVKYRLEENKVTEIPELRITASIEKCNEKLHDGAVYLSAEDLSDICIRNRRNGDVFYPVGMNGTKKLKEFFVDEKVPREQREKIPIISINDKIAAVSDMRTDKHYVYGKNKINFKVILRRCSIGK